LDAVNYGALIKKARNSKGIKAKWVAGQIGVSISTYTEIEAGRRSVTLERAEEIAKVLSMTLLDLLCVHISEARTQKLDATGTTG